MALRNSPSTRQRSTWIDAISPREMEVLHLLARGLSNAEIGTELIVGGTTVKTHVARILDKLGARDRVQAVSLRMSRGWSSPPGAERVR